ncbi:MAG: hypothetical protein FJ148_03875 [Deltaproteobacteria bacterium]|nr:hypothetical protein [Deltaproteobacteria bacterium]
MAAAAAAVALGAVRWQACLRASACDLPFAFFLRAHLQENAVGLLSIGTLGTDATRVALVSNGFAAVAVRVLVPAWHDRALAYITQVARSPRTALAVLVAVPMAVAH